jgi:hypothetical protein
MVEASAVLVPVTVWFLEFVGVVSGFITGAGGGTAASYLISSI